jgi:hypothetical protein
MRIAGAVQQFPLEIQFFSTATDLYTGCFITLAQPIPYSINFLIAVDESG